MTTPGTLALLIPAYNAAAFLPRLLRSVAAQTRPFDEVWVYDDCSTDNTAEVARSFGARVMRGDQNRGCAYGKNALARRTTCDWVHFHDADDELLPGFVERARAWISRDAYDVVVFGSMQRDEATGKDEIAAVHSAEALSADAVRYTIRTKINSICGIYRRTAFLAAGGYDTDPSVLYNEDVAMHCALARAGLRFSADREIFIVNWRRAGSMSNANQVKCLRAQFQVLMKARANDGERKYGLEIAERLWELATAAATYVDWETADQSARLAFELGGLPPSESGIFRALCRLGPRFALRLREGLIRLAKPHYRAGYPAWRLARTCR
jgi:glycosyltransferase involved in cell wall biosynthesis